MTAQDAKFKAEEKYFLEMAHKTRLQNEETERIRAVDRASAERRHIFIFDGDVNRGSVRECIDEMGHWSRVNAERDESPQPMHVIFCTPGGSVYHGLALFDFLLELRGKGHHITTQNLGMCFSMGSILLQAGDHRIMSRNSYMMIHEPSKVFFLERAGASELMDDAEHHKKVIWPHMAELLAERSTMSAEEIIKFTERRDVYLRAKEALERGFVDELV